MRVNRDFNDADLAGFLQTADEDTIRVALAGTEQEKIEALRSAIDAGAASGSVDGSEVFARLLAKYRPLKS